MNSNWFSTKTALRLRGLFFIILGFYFLVNDNLALNTITFVTATVILINGIIWIGRFIFNKWVGTKYLIQGFLELILGLLILLNPLASERLFIALLGFWFFINAVFLLISSFRNMQYTSYSLYVFGNGLFNALIAVILWKYPDGSLQFLGWVISSFFLVTGFLMAGRSFFERNHLTLK